MYWSLEETNITSVSITPALATKNLPGSIIILTGFKFQKLVFIDLRILEE